MIKKAALPVPVGLLAAACLSACAQAQEKPASAMLACTASSPKKDVTIDYGDSEISIKTKSERAKQVKHDDYLVFKLKPDSDPGPGIGDYGTVTVTVAGKNSASNWIAASGTYNSSSELIVCVPHDLEYDTYEYVIFVAGVGTLDPRVIVVPE